MVDIVHQEIKEPITGNSGLCTAKELILIWKITIKNSCNLIYYLSSRKKIRNGSNVNYFLTISLPFSSTID